MDFEIQSVSDLFSILFKMEGQADLEIATSKDLANLSEDALFLHFKNGYINHILGNYHASVESIQDMDAQYREKALSEIQSRLLDDNSSIHTDSPALSADSGKPALSLSILCYFLLMNFQWQPIRIMEKCHFLSGIIIQAYRLCFNSFPIQFFYCFIYTLNFKCQVT